MITITKEITEALTELQLELLNEFMLMGAGSWESIHTVCEDKHGEIHSRLNLTPEDLEAMEGLKAYATLAYAQN